MGIGPLPQQPISVNGIFASDANLSITDITTNNASTSAHGFLPKGDNNTAHFMRGDVTYASVTDANLSLSDITTNNVSTSNHGFQPKATNAGNTVMRDSGAYGAVTEGYLSLSDVTTANVSTSAHGFTPKAPNAASQYLDGTGAWNNAAWTTYTPTWANLTVGNSTNNGRYMQIAKSVFFEIEFTLGSTGSVGTGPTFTLPVTSVSYSANGHPLGVMNFYHPGGSGVYSALAMWNSTTTCIPKAWSTGGAGGSLTYAGVSATAPFTWATNDMIIAHGFYEAA